MERDSSVDELSTLMKLDTQGDAATSYASSSVAVASSSGSSIGSNWVQTSHRLHVACPEDVAGEQTGKRMNRSASEWSFQEFLRSSASFPNASKLSVVEEEGGKSKECDGLPQRLIEDGMNESIQLQNKDLESTPSEGQREHINSGGVPEQHEVSEALYPLFTGLTHEPTIFHSNPQEYESLLKKRLDL
eukprot:c26935_g2_i2 orf=266-832(+)